MLNISMIVRAKITEPIIDGIRTDSVLYFVALPTYFPQKKVQKGIVANILTRFSKDILISNSSKTGYTIAP